MPEKTQDKKAQDESEKDSAKRKKIKKIWTVVIVALIVVLIPVIGFFATKLIIDAGKPEQFDLVDLTGLTVEEAQAVYEGKNITIEVAEEVFDAEVEEGKIILQEPPFTEGAKIDENSTIKLTVSKGIETVTMKKVVGMKFDEAERLLRDELKLEVEKVEETSETVEEDYVIRQEPEEGEELKTGDTVKVYVSIGTGIKEISVPYVIGDTEADAKTKLADLEVTVVYEEDMTRTEGKVLKQSIEAGETVEEGTKITITVNRIEDLTKGKIEVNLTSLLGDKATIEKDETGAEINPTVVLRIEVNGEDVYREENQRKDSGIITREIEDRGTVTVKVFIDEVKYAEKQFTLSGENPTLVID